MTSRIRCTVKELDWRDRQIAAIPLPKDVLRLTLGLASGLTRRRGDPPGRLWAITDRGPNLKIDLAVEHYGLNQLERLRSVVGAKILPLPLTGPTLCELQVTGEGVELLQTMPLMAAGEPLSGLPLPGGQDAVMEPVFDLEGAPLGADPDGADTEALAALPNGGFWVAEEYGPSLLRANAQGEVLMRWTPKGQTLPGARATVKDCLPRRAAGRRLNRGFEGLAASADGARLYVGFQSGLEGQAEGSALIWTLDAQTGALLAEHHYPFERPKAFRQDDEAGKVRRRDLKVCELAWLGPDRLLVLERISRSTKIYRVQLGDDGKLAKDLILDSDGHREIGGGLEGMALLSGRELLLVNDNDFGIEGAPARFFRVTFEEDL